MTQLNQCEYEPETPELQNTMADYGRSLIAEYVRLKGEANDAAQEVKAKQTVKRSLEAQMDIKHQQVGEFIENNGLRKFRCPEGTAFTSQLADKIGNVRPEVAWEMQIGRPRAVLTCEVECATMEELQEWRRKFSRAGLSGAVETRYVVLEEDLKVLHSAGNLPPEIATVETGLTKLTIR